MVSASARTAGAFWRDSHGLTVLSCLCMCASFAIKASMRVPREHIAIRQVVDRLAEIFEVPSHAICSCFDVPSAGGRIWDAVFSVGAHSFALEWKRSGSLNQVALAIHQINEARNGLPDGAIPLLAVPYMGEPARERCAQAGLQWLDLSGNARIVAPGVFYQNLGHSNLFRRPGRPESAFGPKGSRIARRLLIDAGETVRQRTLATSTGLDEGHVSRIVGKLLEAGLVERGRDGIRVTDADLLLDSWFEEYRFDRHTVLRGHIAAGSGDSLARALAGALSDTEVPYAATALPAAWLWTRHAGFRLATVYLPEMPSAALLAGLGFREESRGAQHLAGNTQRRGRLRRGQRGRRGALCPSGAGVPGPQEPSRKGERGCRGTAERIAAGGQGWHLNREPGTGTEVRTSLWSARYVSTWQPNLATCWRMLRWWAVWLHCH